MSIKSELIKSARAVLDKRQEITAADRESLLADLRELVDEHGLATDYVSCEELFRDECDAFAIGLYLGEQQPAVHPPAAVTGSGVVIPSSPPPLPAASSSH
jgi:hypothetical protein